MTEIPAIWPDLHALVRHDLAYYTETRTFGWDSNRGVCVYRGPEGEKCGIGCGFPDSMYQEAFDDGPNPDLEGGGGYGVTNLLDGSLPGAGPLRDLFANIDANDLDRLQSFHDHCADNAHRSDDTDTWMNVFIAGLQDVLSGVSMAEVYGRTSF